MKWIKKYWWIVALIIPITATISYFIYWYFTLPIPEAGPTPDTSNDTSMNDIVNFIKQSEGGYVNDPSDPGGETNKGITYKTWCQYFGSNAHDRFMAMNDDDWLTIFTQGYWDKIMCDQINSVTVANFLVDWYWNSGAYAIGMYYFGTAYGIQPVLNTLGANLTVDGGMGPNTLAAINAADPTALYQGLQANRQAFYNSIAQNDPSQQKFLTGWTNRINDFVKMNVA